MASPRLVAFQEELARAFEAQRGRAEALILRVPGEGQPALLQEHEAGVLQHVAEGIIPPVQGWVKAVQQLAEVERGWGSTERARGAARAFSEATEAFLQVWERVLLVQPATEPMRHVLGLLHLGCYELFLSGPAELARSCADIAAGKAEAKLSFEPAAPSLAQATHELRTVTGRA
jgi:hypothetical protein